MPGYPLLSRETSCSYSGNGDQMCRQDSRVHLSAEEEIAAEESLSAYCKPVELYNILQRRAIRNPIFLQRCLGYKIQAKRKKRIKLTIFMCGTVNDSVQDHGLCPLYILLARRVSDVSLGEYSEDYCFKRACILKPSTELEGSTRCQANFTLPEIKKLAAEANSGSLVILLVSGAGINNTSSRSGSPKYHSKMTSFPSYIGGSCLWGKIAFQSLYLAWEKSLPLSVGERAEMMSTVDMHSCFLKPACLNEEKYVSIQTPGSETVSSKQVQISISAEEVGAEERSPYDLYTYDDIPPSSLPHIVRLRTGNVIFNYRYYNNKLQRTEVTEDFACPFCLVKCASFKGLRYHLPSSHDVFNFEFWVTEEYQAVNVSVKSDFCRSEIVADGIDPKQQTFFFCSKPLRRRISKSFGQNAKHVHPFALELDLPAAASQLLNKADGAPRQGEKARILSGSGFQNANLDAMECVEGPTNNLGAPAMLQFAKTRKLSMERSDPRNRALLQKRQFFHSHRAQPMALEQVLSDRDSEDEVDDDVADFEDRRMLDDFVDVTKDEKQLMHMWNSFVRKQRVLADGHIPWACEAFSRLHGHNLVQAPALMWCWRLFMIKLWNHGLLDARGMNNCNIILEQFQNQDSDPIKNG